MFYISKEDEIKIIDKALAMWKKYEDKVEEMETIRDVLKDRFVSKVKCFYGTDPIPRLIEEHFKISETVRKNSSITKSLKRVLNMEFGKYNWKLNQIIICGFDSFAYEIPFSANGKEYSLKVPNYKNLTSYNIEAIEFGAYCLYRRDSKNTITFLYAHYKKEKVAEFIKAVIAE